jgi:2-polyprenyl-3-methyl-5-hydroxy-6-metoxy-1,4-benzoquinol methylase
MQLSKHWEKVYKEKATTEVSWYQPHAALSLKLIQELDIPTTAAIIDIGGGASILVDDLLARNYQNITVLDISRNALRAARARLCARSENVRWLETNILQANLPPNNYDLWHDRAVFHFLLEAEDRQKYVRLVQNAVKPGGLAIMATFAEDGPTMCSGLPVRRYSAEELDAEFGESFTLLRHEKESHQTPAGSEQKFVYCVFRKTSY